MRFTERKIIPRTSRNRLGSKDNARFLTFALRLVSMNPSEKRPSGLWKISKLAFALDQIELHISGLRVDEVDEAHQVYESDNRAGCKDPLR
jgi:hypothetical protein